MCTCTVQHYHYNTELPKGVRPLQNVAAPAGQQGSRRGSKAKRGALSMTQGFQRLGGRLPFYKAGRIQVKSQSSTLAKMVISLQLGGKNTDNNVL